MRKVLKSFFAVLLVSLLSAQIFAAEGTVTFVKGKVEVQRGGSWVSLKVGDKVAQSEIINTGFQSEAKVKLMDSVLYLGPVTRVSLDQLSSSSDKDKVNVYLSTGTVRSKVNRTNDKKVSYTVRTPIAVASVRGTEFFTKANGENQTLEGTIAVGSNQQVYGQKKVLPGQKDDTSDSEKKAEADSKIEDTEELPNIMYVRAGQKADNTIYRGFGTPKANSTDTAMDVLKSVATEGTKQSMSQSSNKSVANIINDVINNSVGSGPKTGSIKVQIGEPTTGNVEVQVTTK